MTESTSSSLLNVALARIHQGLDPSTRALLGSCQIRAMHNGEFWYVVVMCPSTTVWNRLAKRLESLTRRFERLFPSFTLGLCTADEPMPLGGEGIGWVERHFLIEDRWFAQLKNTSHANWVEVVPTEWLQADEDDDDDEDDLPF